MRFSPSANDGVDYFKIIGYNTVGSINLLPTIFYANEVSP